MVGVLAGVYWPPWPVDPEIHPKDTVDGSSLILPFTIRNRSPLFDMKDVQFRCGVDLVYAEDSSGGKLVLRDSAFISGIFSVPRDGPLNYPCDASKLLQVRPDGSLSAYGSSTQFESSKRFHPPFHILKMCVWIGGEYKVIGLIPWQFTSVIFQWPATPTLHQWIEGPIAREPPKEEQLPGFVPDALECSKAVRFPYALTTGPGQQILIMK